MECWCYCSFCRMVEVLNANAKRARRRQFEPITSLVISIGSHDKNDLAEAEYYKSACSWTYGHIWRSRTPEKNVHSSRIHVWT